MPVFDDFIPEELEAPKRELTALLEQTYQQPTLIEETISQTEQQRILAEARACLLAADPASRGQASTPPPMILLADKEQIAPVQPSARPTGKRRLSRTARLFNAIAATLAVAALIAGSVILFTNRGSTKLGNTAQIATIAPCLPANTIEGVGLDYICTQHLYQDLQLVQSEGQYRITLTKGYADQGQVLVWYQIEKKVNGHYQLIKAPDVALGGGGQLTSKPDQTLLNMGPLNWPGITGWSLVPAQGGSFNKGTAQTIEGQLDVAGMTLLSPTVESITFPTTLHFHFSLPVHGNWHSLSLQQTEIANGHGLTLTSVGYSLSLIDIFLQSSEPWFSDTYKAPIRPYGLPIVTSFKVNNVECILNPKSRFYQGASADQPYKGIQVGASKGEFWQNLNCSLAGAGVAPHSEVTLTISMYSTTTLRNTTLPPGAVWTFHFQLP
jgi:hypothetical protein